MLSIKYKSPVYDFQHVKDTFAVGRMLQVNDTFATITPTVDTGVREVRVWNGKTTVLLQDGSEQMLCSSDMSCSSLQVDSSEELEVSARSVRWFGSAVAAVWICWWSCMRCVCGRLLVAGESVRSRVVL